MAFLTTALIGAFKALLAAKAAGEVKGLLVSRTIGGAVASVGLFSPELIDLASRALAREPEAIGRLVLIAASYIAIVWGRYKVGERRPVRLFVNG